MNGAEQRGNQAGAGDPIGSSRSMVLY